MSDYLTLAMATDPRGPADPEAQAQSSIVAQNLPQPLQVADNSLTMPSAGYQGPRTIQLPSTTIQDYIGLPDMQRLPEGIRSSAANAMMRAGLSTREGGMYARMLWQESKGQMLDAKGGPLTSWRGARGVGQLMPETFADMQ